MNTPISTIKKVIVLLTADSSRSGAPRQVFYLARGLAERGHQVHCLCPEGWLPEELAATQVRVHLLKENRLKKIVQEVTTLYEGIKPDIIHCHGVRGGLWGRMARRPEGAKLVYTEHLWTASFHLPSLFREKAQKFSLRRLATKTDHVVAVSKAVHQFLLQSGMAMPEKSSVIYGAIEPIAPGKSVVEPVIGTLGGLSWVKGVSVLLRALPGVVEKYPDLWCRVGGEGKEKEALIQMARALPVDPHIEWLGEVSNTPAFYHGLQIYIQPSLSESFGLAVLEAMSAGLPVIVSHTGGLPEIVSAEENGVLVPVGDAEALVEAIKRLLSNKEERERMGAAGRKRAAEFTIDRMVKAHQELYMQILS